ncbi:hypothetical protein K32_01150 [Kaistia sp. 32K]|uniref:hypothetical protein n=1 Tax=Kaistia sp. 32K TaxID=2795690 RepID=UPI0019164F2C|nr:hypothetical protein [Kaistia sp. 32K]BCP51498.1 hypothetical protein K32_01150 [Kaistia sp. 32K]
MRFRQVTPDFQPHPNTPPIGKVFGAMDLSAWSDRATVCQPAEPDRNRIRPTHATPALWGTGRGAAVRLAGISRAKGRSVHRAPSGAESAIARKAAWPAFGIPEFTGHPMVPISE